LQTELVPYLAWKCLKTFSEKFEDVHEKVLRTRFLIVNGRKRKKGEPP